LGYFLKIMLFNGTWKYAVYLFVQQVDDFVEFEGDARAGAEPVHAFHGVHLLVANGFQLAELRPALVKFLSLVFGGVFSEFKNHVRIESEKVLEGDFALGFVE